MSSKNTPVNIYKNISLKNLPNEIWYKCDFFDKGVFYQYGKYYAVSSLGRVKSFSIDEIDSEGKRIVKPEQILKLKPGDKGYLRVMLSNRHLYNKRKKFLVHRLVMLCAKIANPLNKPHVNHLKGIKTDNRLSQLEWATHSENIKHAIDNKLLIHVKGENQWCSKLNENDVLHILNNNTDKYQDLAAKYGVSITVISSIKCGRNWGWLTKLPKKDRKRKGEHCGASKITEKKVLEIVHSNESATSLSVKMNISASAIRAIKRGQNWNWLTGIKKNKNSLI